MEQRFTLPGLPLHRDLQAPVTIGTQFSVRATPIEHDKRIVTFTLVTDNGEAALEIALHLPGRDGRGGKLRAISRSATSESSPLEKEVSTLALNKELILGVIVKEHVFEIYLDTVFLLPFVHRVNPSEIKKMVLDGAMICNEVVVVPVKTEMPPLPQYNEVSLSMRPLQPTMASTAGSVPPPLPPPRQHPPVAGAVAVLPPYPEGTAIPVPAAAAAPATAASIVKPEPVGWMASAPPIPAPSPPMPQPQRVQHPYPQLSQAAAQQQPLPPPPRFDAAPAGAVMVPTTSSGPATPAVTPMPYGGAPLPPQAYPHNPQPQGTGPQFQNIQNIPGLSYATGGQQQMQQYPYPQQQQVQMQQHYTQYQQQPYQQYPQYPGTMYQPYQPYTVQYPYTTYPTAYMNDHCHYDYHHHHHW